MSVGPKKLFAVASNKVPFPFLVSDPPPVITPAPLRVRVLALFEILIADGATVPLMVTVVSAAISPKLTKSPVWNFVSPPVQVALRPVSHWVTAGFHALASEV